MHAKLFWGIFFAIFSAPFLLKAAPPSSQASLPPASQPAHAWRVQKAKNFPNYRVEIITQDNPTAPLGIESTKALIKDLNGNVKVEIKDVLIEPDPKENISGWAPGTLLDVDKDGLEDLVLRTYSAGAHCCYTYQIFSLGKVLKKLGELKLMDYGETIKLQDLDGNGQWQIIAGNAKFTYLKGIPFSASPAPPQIFALVNGKYINVDKKYPKVFDKDIAEQKEMLANGFNETAVLQIVLDYLLTGREAQAWSEFDQLYTSANKEARKQELQERWNQYLGLKVESNKAESKTSPSTGWKLP